MTRHLILSQVTTPKLQLKIGFSQRITVTTKTSQSSTLLNSPLDV